MYVVFLLFIGFVFGWLAHGKQPFKRRDPLMWPLPSEESDDPPRGVDRLIEQIESRR